MLRLQKITAKFTQPVFEPLTQLHLILKTQKTTKSTTKPAKLSANLTASWSQQMTLSSIDQHSYNYRFQICRVGTSIDQKLEGTIQIDTFKQNHGQWEILNRQGQEVVSSMSEIKRNLMKSQQNLTIQYETPSKNLRVLRILSIVAKMPNRHIKKGYFCIEIGQQVIKTPELKSRSGQLIFIEPRQIQLMPEDNSAQIKIYSCKLTQQQPIAESAFNLSSDRETKKLPLMKDSFQAGQLYIELRIANKSQIPTTNYVQNSNKDKTKSINELQQPLLIKSKSKGVEPSRYSSLDYSLLDSYIGKNSRVSPSNKSKLDSSMISSTTSAKRRNSVLNDNGTIMFPREKRFSVFQDKQNQKISYLGLGIRSFQFKNEGVGGRYRGASFGYGDKTDFVSNKNLPGVGNYKLPSIWDRY